MNKIAILTNGGRAFSSSRFRGWWLEDANPVRFKAYGPGDFMDGIDDCDAVVFQKRQADVDIERARRYKAEGRTVIYDITEPMWWFDPPGTLEMMRLADAVTTSSPALTAAAQENSEVRMAVTIPDRMLPSFHPDCALHGDRERLTFVWYGATDNRIALTGALPLLKYLSFKHPIELRIIDGAPQIKLEMSDPERAKVVHIPWSLETFHAQLTACDIALLPPYPGPWGALKSNNKHVTAWWAGLPVVSGFDLGELTALAENADRRQAVGQANRELAEAEYGIGKSIAQWLELVAEIQDGAAIARDLTAHPEELIEQKRGAAVVRKNGQSNHVIESKSVFKRTGSRAS